MLTHLSLFSGIGGLDLAAEAAGFKTVGQCEWADYQTKVLEKHWPDVPRWRDIRTLTGDSFYEKTGLRTVDIISGGFPCQPFSVAGKQKGKEDNRYLWPEMLRVIRELKPRWVISENAPGILRIAAWTVATDLEREGFDTVVFDFEALSIGAPQRRKRVAFVGNRKTAPMDEAYSRSGRAANNLENAGHSRRVGQGILSQLERGTEFGRNGETVADPTRAELYGSEQHKNETGFQRLAKHGGWAIEPDVGRVAHGVPNRVDRLKCLGNAVVPQQFYPIFKAIYEVEKGENHEQ